MVADVPLGVFLSGGVDSTLIAAIATRVSREPVKTFTVGYDVGDVSETAAARRTAEALGTDHHELVLSQSQLAERVPSLFRSLDQPLADQALVSLHAVAEHARKTVTVAVGGEGADELFAGYPRYRWLDRAAQLSSVVPQPVAAGSARAIAAAPRLQRARRLADVLEPKPMLERHLDWVTSGRRGLRERLYGPALRAGLDAGRVTRGLELTTAGLNGASVPRQFMQLDQRHWLVDDVLVKADRAGMRVSLEIRTPYLHPDIAEFAATVPEQVHLQDGGKFLLRRLLADLLPAGRGRRPKTAFRAPAADWLRGPLAPVLEEQVRSGPAFGEGWFDAAEVQRMHTAHVRGEHDWSQALWPVLAFSLWLDGTRHG
jgi:asparagine synthase (glutamine-hydrolysing)